MAYRILMGNRFSIIDPPLDRGYAWALARSLCYWPDDPNESPWYGYDPKRSLVYTGLVPLMVKMMRRDGCAVKIEDNRRRKFSPLPISTNVTLRDYQQAAVDRLVSVGRGTISAATGSGKTVIAIETFARCGVPGVIIVPTQVIWSQFIRSAIRLLLKDGETLPDDFEDMTVKEMLEWAAGKTKCLIGAIGQGMWSLGRLIIAISAALNENSKRCRDLFDRVDFTWSDEHHHGAAGTWFNNLMRSDAYYRFGGSGTMLRTDGQDLKLFATTGPIIHSITSSYLIEKGWLAKPIIKMIKVNLPCAWTGGSWIDHYRSNVLYNTDRTLATLQIIGDSIKRRIKTLVLVGWDEHAQNLLARMSSDTLKYIGYVKAAMGRKHVRETIERFGRGEFPVLIATPLLSEGYDLCSLDRLVRASAMKSAIKVTQETGRVLRVENPPRPGVCTEVFDFFDDDQRGPLLHHSRQRLKCWKSEEAFEVSVIDLYQQPDMKALWENGYLDINDWKEQDSE